MSNKEDPMEFKKPEILAPAGDMNGLLGAIKGGVDAVYLGVGEFNARQGAKNFTLDNLEEAIDLAHSHGVLVFLALNIPIKQNELQDALDVVDRAYSYGIDAVILEDLGLLGILKETYPDMELHTSTQMTIHNKEGVDLVSDMGAKRAIVSRELNTKQLKDIVDSSDIGIEVFMHGALCYSYSGRCLFSSFLNDRSANRGACAQPCRRRYKLLVNGKRMNNRIGGDYPISCAELCTISGLEDIIESGVESLKIEGRMKKPEYVTKSASVYKDAVESIYEKSEHLEDVETREKELAKLFYRGFTKGFILDDRDVTHPKYSSNYGVFLGRVLEISNFRYTTSITLKLNEDIHLKDGIGIHTKSRMLGSAVNVIVSESGDRVKSASKGEKVTLEISSKTGKAVKLNDEVYLTTDTRLMDALQKTDLKRSPVSIKVTARMDEKLSIEIESENGNVKFTDDYVVQPAEKAPTTIEKIKKAIERMGDTPYFADQIDIDADKDIFVPVGVLTNARRSASDLLLLKTISGYKRDLKTPSVPEASISCARKKDNIEDKENTLLSVEVSDVASLFSAAEGKADIIYIPIDKFDEATSSENEKKLNALKEREVEMVFMTPQISHDHEMESLKPLIKTVSDAGFNVSCSNLGTVQLAKTLDVPFVVQKELNTFNSFTCNTFYDAGAYRVTLSSELNMEEIKDVCDALKICEGQVEVMVYGRELLLVTEHDLLKPLVDRNILKENSDVLLVDQKDFEYPVKRWGARTLIYDSKVLNMLKYIKNLNESGVDVLRLDLSLYRDKEVKEITKAYRKALSGRKVNLNSRNNEIYTKGHYFKGI